MNTRISGMLMFAFALLLTMVITKESKAQEGVWKIGPRTLPASAGELDLKHPYVSPIYGNFSDFPPSYIISGTRDCL